MKNPEKLIDREAKNEDGVVGVIRYWDEKREKFIGHESEDNGKYWESFEPQLLVPIEDEEENEKKSEDAD